MNFDLFLELEPLITHGMSRFQMQNFVINDSITPYRKLRQALMELKARAEVLTNGEFDLQENQLKLKKAQQEAAALTGIDREIKEVEVRRLEYIINRTSTVRLQQTQEAEFFMGVASELVEEFGGVERAKEVLGDPEVQYREETEYWTRRLGRGVFSDLINYGTISKGLVESISNLPMEIQQDIVRVALSQQETLTKLLEDTKDTMLVERD